MICCFAPVVEPKAPASKCVLDSWYLCMGEILSIVFCVMKRLLVHRGFYLSRYGVRLQGNPPRPPRRWLVCSAGVLRDVVGESFALCQVAVLEISLDVGMVRSCLAVIRGTVVPLVTCG